MIWLIIWVRVWLIIWLRVWLSIRLKVWLIVYGVDKSLEADFSSVFCECKDMRENLTCFTMLPPKSWHIHMIGRFSSV